MQIKNIVDLRDSLAKNYHEMETEKMPLKLGKELANSAGKILTSCKVQMDYNQLMGYKKGIDFLEVDTDNHVS